MNSIKTNVIKTLIILIISNEALSSSNLNYNNTIESVNFGKNQTAIEKIQSINDSNNDKIFKNNTEMLTSEKNIIKNKSISENITNEEVHMNNTTKSLNNINSIQLEKTKNEGVPFVKHYTNQREFREYVYCGKDSSKILVISEDNKLTRSEDNGLTWSEVELPYESHNFKKNSK